MIDEQGHPNTGGAAMLDHGLTFFRLQQFQPIGFCQCSAYFFRHPGCLRGRDRFVGIQLFQQHHEFITSKARNGIFFAHTIYQTARGFHQQQIANIVAMFIIERLKVIQIQEHQRAVMAAALAGRHGLPQTVNQQATVGQLRQRIIKRHIFQMLFGGLARGDVAL